MPSVGHFYLFALCLENEYTMNQLCHSTENVRNENEILKIYYENYEKFSHQKHT